MGRPEKPIATENKALAKLAQWLRDQRSRAGNPDYRELGKRVGCHGTRLMRAASGARDARVPPWSAVLAYVRSCDASPDVAKALWKAARHEEARLRRGGHTYPAPRADLVRDLADLSAALRELYEKAGSPTLRTMEEKGGPFGELPRSTAHRIIKRQTVPQRLAQFRAFLEACEVPEGDRGAWEAAWSRAWRHEKQDDMEALVDHVGRLVETEPEAKRRYQVIYSPPDSSFRKHKLVDDELARELENYIEFFYNHRKRREWTTRGGPRTTGPQERRHFFVTP